MPDPVVLTPSEMRAAVCAAILAKIDAPDTARLTVGSIRQIVAEVAAVKDE